MEETASQALGAVLLFLAFAAALRAGLALLRGKIDWGRAALEGAEGARALGAGRRDAVAAGLLAAGWGLSLAPHPAALIAAAASGAAGAALALTAAAGLRRRIGAAPGP